MAKWILEKEANRIIFEANLEYMRFDANDSPYSRFDVVGITPHTEETGGVFDKRHFSVQISSVEIKSADPATAYKGRHGTGRLILLTDEPDGIGVVPSNSKDIQLILADGTCLGRPDRVVLSDLF